MTYKVSYLLLLIFHIILFCISIPYGEARHILAVDLGADWAKAATLGSSIITGSNTISMRANIVLNDQTNRKSPQCIAFRFLNYKGNESIREVERFFAEQAQALEPRFPAQVVCGPSLLAGFTLRRETEEENNNNKEEINLLSDDDIATLPFSVIPSSARHSAVVRITRHNNDNIIINNDNNDNNNNNNNNNNNHQIGLEFTAEELVGMFLGYMKRMAERGLDGEPVRHLTVTIPILSSISHRQSIIDAAALAGLRTLRVIHSTTAAAVQLAYMNTEQFFTGVGPAKYILLLDMGSRRTEAAVYRFTSNISNNNNNNNNNNINIKRRKAQRGTIEFITAAVNTTLGGRAFDRCLAQYAMQLFQHHPTNINNNNNNNNNSNSYYSYMSNKDIDGMMRNPTTRRMAVSLLRAANAARERLSVNKEAPFIIQGLNNNNNNNNEITLTITRAAFEKECGELFNEVLQLRNTAIMQTNGIISSIKEFTRFEVLGGATRMPGILQKLSEGYGLSVDRTLNSDEAAVMGAALMSGSLSTQSFNIIEPLMHDIYFSVDPPLLGEKFEQKQEKENNNKNKNSSRNIKNRYQVFVKGETKVPALHSLRFQNRTSDFTLILQDNSGYFTRTTLITGVNKSLEMAAQLPQLLLENNKKRKNNNDTKELLLLLSLESTEVVVEVAISESGIPYIPNAYLRAIYLQEISTVVVQEEEDNKKLEGDINSTDPFVNSSTSTVEENTTNEGDINEVEKINEEENEEEERDEEEKNKDEQNDESEIREENEESNYAKNTSNNNNNDSSTTEENTKQEVSKRVVKSFPLHLVAALNSLGINIDKTEALKSRDRLRAFQRLDDERMLRSALRNDLEALILHYKSLESWDSTTNNNEEKTEWRDIVKGIDKWFDDTPDDVEISALQEKLQQLKNLQVK